MNACNTQFVIPIFAVETMRWSRPLRPPMEPTTHHYAAEYRQLRKQGTPIPTIDMWMAALALQHSLALYDRDDHFDALRNLCA